MKQTKTLYSFSNWRYELLNLYQKNSETKNFYLCAAVFLPLLSSPSVLILILKVIIWNFNQQQYIN